MLEKMMTIFHIFIIFKLFKIWDSSLITMSNMHVLLKTNPFFDRNRENMMSLWHHLRLTYYSLKKFLRPGCVKLMKIGVHKIWWQYLLSFLSYGKKVEGGAFRPPPLRGGVNISSQPACHGVFCTILSHPKSI